MNIKIPLLLMLLSMLATASISPTEKRIVYSNGVQDTLMIGEKYFSNKEVFLQKRRIVEITGYACMVDATDYNEAKIIRISALAVKNNLDVKFVEIKHKDMMVFSITDRKADAIYIQRRLKGYNIPSRIEFLNAEFPYVDLAGRKMLNIIKNNFKEILDNKNSRISELEAYLRKIKSLKNNTLDYSVLNDDSVVKLNTQKEYNMPDKKAVHKYMQKCKKPIIKEVISLKNLQVVNRVITKKYLMISKKNHKKIHPLNDRTARTMTIEKVSKQQRIVGKNIRKDFNKKIPKISSFSGLYKYIKEHAGITEQNSLILHGKAFKKGEKLLRWKITDINYKTGIVIVDNSYNIHISKKR